MAGATGDGSPGGSRLVRADGGGVPPEPVAGGLEVGLLACPQGQVGGRVARVSHAWWRRGAGGLDIDADQARPGEADHREGPGVGDRDVREAPVREPGPGAAVGRGAAGGAVVAYDDGLAQEEGQEVLGGGVAPGEARQVRRDPVHRSRVPRSSLSGLTNAPRTGL